jgi:hypothetical protein
MAGGRRGADHPPVTGSVRTAGQPPGLPAPVSRDRLAAAIWQARARHAVTGRCRIDPAGRSRRHRKRCRWPGVRAGLGLWGGPPVARRAAYRAGTDDQRSSLSSLHWCWRVAVILTLQAASVHVQPAAAPGPARRCVAASPGRCPGVRRAGTRFLFGVCGDEGFGFTRRLIIKASVPPIKGFKIFDRRHCGHGSAPIG